jgi:predicted RNase H-like HicB family nuclease
MQRSHTYNFSIIIERDKDGYAVSCPELQGCYTQGDTYEEAMENIKDVIQLHIESRLERNEEIPQAQQSISISSVAVAI